MISNQDVFNSDKHGVSNVEGIVGIGWRHDYAKPIIRGFGIAIWIKRIAFFPELIDVFFVLFVVVLCVHYQ
jgi:hypothetical protein